MAGTVAACEASGRVSVPAWRRALLLLVVAAVAGAACSTPAQPRANPAPSTTRPPSTADAAGVRAVVAFVGDSNISLGGKWPVWDLTRGTGGLVTADHLDDSYVPVFVARSGAGIRAGDCLASVRNCPDGDFWSSKLRATFAKIRVDAVVTNLGIDDAFTRGTADSTGYAGYPAKVDWFMRLIPRSVPVFWTNLPCAIEPKALADACGTINAALAQARARWPNLTVVDWAGAAGDHASYMDDNVPPQLRVHYADAGYRAWSALVTKSLDARFPKS